MPSASKPRISSTFLRYTLGLTFSSIILLGLIWAYQGYQNFDRETRIMRETYLANQRELLASEVQRVVDYIEYEKARTEERLKNTIREKVYEAHAIADNLYQRYKKELPEEEVRKLIRETLRPIRFNDGRGYFFITRMDGVAELIPWLENEGENLLTSTDLDGQAVVRSIIDLVREKGEGFLTYDWPKIEEKGVKFPKIAFAKLFSPYDYYIGTGDYLDDVGREIQREVLSRVEKMRFGKDGYFFIGQYDGFSLLNPGKGRNMIGAQDENGVKIVQELIAAAKQGGGFVSYVMPRFEGYKAAPKLSYAQGIQDGQWYVGAGQYIDEIDGIISDRKKDMTRVILAGIGKVAGLMFVLMAASYLLVKRFARKINDSFDHFTMFFSRAADDSIELDPSAMNFEVFEQLAESANRMIRDRRRAEESLAASEERYRSVVDQAADSVFVSNLEGRIVDVNLSACESLGYTREELLRKAVWELDPKHPEKDAIEDAWAALKPGGSIILESVHQRKDGTVFPVELRVGLLRIKDQKLVLGIARDITERKRAEQALRENELKFRTVADFTHDWEIWRDPEGRFIYTSPSCERITGRKPEEFIHDSGLLMKIVHADDLPKLKAYSSACSGPDSGVENLEYRIMHADGSIRWANQTCNPVFDENGRWLGRRISIRDITRTKSIELEREKLEKQLNQAQKMEAVGTLAGGIAHDFNNLLQAINGYAEIMLFDKKQGDKGFKELNEIRKACARAVDLIRQLLAFSRKAESRRQPVDPNHEILQAKQILERTIPKMIEIELNLVPEAWTISADPNQFEQVLLNLGSNAADAMPEGGKLLIETMNVSLDPDYCSVNLDATPGDYVVLRVTDTGQGMNRETLEHIFEPFYTTKEVGKGTGLGLASVYGIVKSHGGRITCYSEPGRGTSFSIYLPALEQTPASPRTAQEIEMPAGGTETVLVVDDEASIRGFAADVLSRFGYTVRTAFSGEDALELFSKEGSGIDLVLLDLGMPGMGGHKCLTELLKLKPTVKVVIASGYSMDGQVRRVTEAGAAGFIAKPYRLTDLLFTLRKALDAE